MAVRGGYKWALFFGMFLILIDGVSYTLWAGNFVAVNLDNQNDDRYVTLIFWRLSIMAVGIFPVFGWGLYFSYTKSTTFLFFLALLMTVFTLAVQLTAYGWYIVDLVMCSTLVHCYGNGNGPFGVDVAFLIVLITTAVEIISSTLLMIVGMVVRHGAVAQNAYSYYSRRKHLGGSYSSSERQDTMELELPSSSGGAVVKLRRNGDSINL
jgi:hypothetical protein